MRDRRKNIRLKEYDYSKRGAYFVTVCTRNRAEILGSLSVIGQLYDDSTVEVQEPCRGECTFAKAECVGRPYVKYSALGRIAFETLEKIEMKFPCQICDYMIMPDHIHLVLLLNVERATARVAPTEENGDRNSVTLGRIVGAYKSMIADTRRKMCDQENVQTGAIWQRGYYDHVIRSPEELYRIRKYIRENPIRKYYEQDRIHTMSTRERTCK